MQRAREKSANLLMWVAPFLVTGAYLLVAWRLLRWNEGELLFVLCAAMVAGLAGIGIFPMRWWQKSCLAALYVPVMGYFLFMASFMALGCGVFGHCL